MIADAAAIERNLYLLAELLCLPAPIVLGINMMDVAAAEGIEIEAHVLSAALGLPVVPMVGGEPHGRSAGAHDCSRALGLKPGGLQADPTRDRRNPS